MSNYPPDPGGVFASDLHRRVAAHLHSEEEGMGWDEVTLLQRLAEDHATPLPPVVEGLPDYQAGLEALREVLGELIEAELALKDGDAWALTEEGLAALTGPIANEPQPGAPVAAPAVIDLGPIPLGGKATVKGGVTA